MKAFTVVFVPYSKWNMALPIAMILFFHPWTDTYAQHYVNKEWSHETGLPDELEWSASVLDAQGSVIFVGNTLASPGDPDVLITKIDRSGDQLWQQTYSGNANAHDYGVAIAADQLGALYVAAATTTSLGALDVVLLKYDPDGTLIWSQVWGGINGLPDVPSSIALDQQGNIYVAGCTYAAPNDPDFLVLKISSAGALLWSTTYDHLGFADAATGITISADQQPVVAGASATSFNAWDHTTLKLDAATGAELDEVRVQVPGVGLDQVMAFTRGNTDRLYLTGFREVNGQKDMQTICISADFNLQWVKDFDGEGLNDAARGVDTDGQGNVYVVGYSRKGNGGSDIVTMKYALDGSELWSKRYKAARAEWVAEATKAAATADGGVVVVGTVYDGETYNFITLKYDAGGKLEWEREYDGLNGDDKALDLLVDDHGQVYVSGRTANTYTTVKYAHFHMNNDELLDGEGTPFAKDGEMIIKFHSALVDPAFVHDRKLEFTSLDELLPPQHAEDLAAKLNSDPKDVKVFKVYRGFTPADSISTTRLGQDYRLPSFWSTFLVQARLGTDPVAKLNDLNANVDCIEYAQLNFVYHPLSDPLFPTRQQSLAASTQYPNGHINAPAAWLQNTGSPQVKVGVVDELIEFWHPEFQTPSGSKVIAGFSTVQNAGWLDDLGMFEDYFTGPHGTACAGVIGAVRNNDEGIAGLAGGDADQGEYGCSLYSLGVFDENVSNGDGTSAQITEAITLGASEVVQVPNAFGCHLLNNSYGANGFQNPLFDHALRRAIYDAYRNECSFIAAKGNGGGGPHYPADYGSDDNIITVAASGPDGSFMTAQNGGFSVTGGADITAPGSPEMIVSTVGQWMDFPYQAECDPLPERYDCFRLSSAAAAHATGVAALMMSEHSPMNGYINGLAPEDVQHLLEKAATDIVGGAGNYPVGYDSPNGWGRLNAGESVEIVRTPYRVFHSGSPNAESISYGPVQTVQVFDNNGWNEMWNLQNGEHAVQEVTVTHTFINDFGTNSTILDGLGGKPGYWGRPSTTEGALYLQGQYDADWQFMLDGNVLTVTATTKCFKVTTGPNGTIVNRWIPVPPDKIKMPYSVHVRDNFQVGVVEDIALTGLNLFPNPATNQLMITWEDEASAITVFDARGKLIASLDDLPAGQRQYQLNVEAWADGLYTVQLNGEGTRQVQRFAKH